jgi:glycosyltransferase involved in cell wall biosynthesis
VDVLQVITDPARRGAQMFALDLGDALAKMDVGVRTVALGPSAHQTALDVPVLGARRVSPSTVAALRREIRRSDVTVAHGGQTLPACALAGIGMSRPFVYRQISNSLFWASSPARRARVRVALSRATRVVALWEGAAATLEQRFGVRHERVRVIPNAVMQERFSAVDEARRLEARRTYGLDERRFTLVFLGALVRDKGVDLIIEAIGQLASTQLLVAGDGPEAAGLRSLAARLAPGRVVFAGTVPDAADALSAGDAIVLASRGGDSMPAALIEAGLMQLPAVATAVEAIPQIVQSGVTGELVAPDVDALARAIAQLAADPERVAALGRRARRHCLDRFSIVGVSRQWADLLHEAASAAGAS